MKGWLSVDQLAEKLIALFGEARLGHAERAVAAADMAGELITEAVAAKSLDREAAETIRQSLLAGMMALANAEAAQPRGPAIGQRVVANTVEGRIVSGEVLFHGQGGFGVRCDDASGHVSLVERAGLVRVLPDPPEGAA